MVIFKLIINNAFIDTIPFILNFYIFSKSLMFLLYVDIKFNIISNLSILFMLLHMKRSISKDK